MTFLLLLIAAYGICFGLQHKIGFLHGKLGIVDSMLACSYCTGYHAGWITLLLSKLIEGPLELSLGLIVELTLFAFASSAFCYIMDCASAWLESNTQSQG